MFVILVLILVSVLICYELFFEKKAKICGKKIPGPPVYPIIGNGHLFIGSSAKFLNTLDYLFREFGDRSRAFLGAELFIFLSNPQDVECLMSSMDYIDKSDDYKSLKPWLGEGLLTATGSKWKKHRKFLTPSFHFSILQDFLPVFEQNAKILINSLNSKSDGKQIFDVYEYITLCALDDICESAMGVAMGAQTNSDTDYVRAVREISTLTNYRMRHFLLRHDFFFNMSETKVKQTKALKVLHDFTENVIRNRKQQIKDNGITLENLNDVGTKKRINFLDLLLLKDLDGRRLSDEAVREEVDTFMFEGHDTTTSALCFTLYLISGHPAVQEKLYKEQLAIYSDDIDRDYNNSDLNDMKYLDMVIKESLRLYPSVPLVARRIPQDTDINGMELCAGTTVMVDIFHLQRHPELYDRPLEFRPERFELDEITKRSPYSWISFSAGPRNCIGQKFAMMEMKSTLSRLLRAFEWTSAGIEPELSLDLILKPTNGINVSLKKRNHGTTEIINNGLKNTKLRRCQ